MVAKLIFLNIGWMKNYRGFTAGDNNITGGGSYVQEHGFGHEIFNFAAYQGHMYGYVQPKDSIGLERLGASKNDTEVDNVLAIWVSKSPDSGVVIIGWYKDATVYRTMQHPPEKSGREYKGYSFGYWVKARRENCTLLPLDKRIFQIPRRQKGGMGQSNVWYADDPSVAEFRQDVINFVNTDKIPTRQNNPLQDGQPRQPDPYKRQRVEQIAITLTTGYYANLGYSVDSVEKDNVGWDLEAKLDNKLVRLEVKGLSQNEIQIELTPNEYASLQKYRETYRLCIVTGALSDSPNLRIFSFSPDNHTWEDDAGNQLTIVEVKSAKMHLA